jgi:hypothetical protein
MGGLFHQPPIAVGEVDDITEKTMEALVWGKTFTAGAIFNSLLVGLIVYGMFRLTYAKIRPGMLAYFRRHAKDHQRRFGSQRLLNRRQK